METVHINVTVQGVTPLICNKFGDAAALAATDGNRISAIGERGTPKEQAAAKLYIGLDGNPMIPQPNIFRCVVDGGIFFKSGRSKVTTQKSSMIPACIDIAGVEIPLISKEGWQVDTRAVCIPSTGGRILCHRPYFNDWKLQFRLGIDPSMITVKLVRDIMDAAGKRIGLGDFRPSRKGPYGKFVVVQWDESDNEPES